MSNLLKAIERSEQSHSVHHQAASRHSGAAMVSSLRATRPRRLPVWLLPVLIVALPVAGAIGYTRLTPATQTQSSSLASVIPAERSAVSAVSPAAVPDIAGKIPGVEFLPYPNLVTEPLTVGAMSYAVTLNKTSYQNEAATDGRRNGRSSSLAGDTASNNTGSNNWELDDLDLSELSPELARQLQSAIAATDGEPLQEEMETVNNTAADNVNDAQAAIAIGDLPAAVQNRIPTLDFQTHIYSSTANSRWVKVNGKEAYEGDELAPGVVLRRIEPRQVVFDFESYHIVMPALSEW